MKPFLFEPGLVSVYILNFNYGKFLSQAIESCLVQTYDNIELTIIDDGSNDNSREVLKQYEKINGIKIVYQDNIGLTASNNNALNLAHGEFIIRLDADDFFEVNAIMQLVRALRNKPTASLAYSNYNVVSESGRIIEQMKLQEPNQLFSVLDTPMHGACTLFRRKDLIEIGGYNEKFSRQDGYYIWMFFNSPEKLAFVNLLLFNYRRHRNNLTNDGVTLLETRADITKHHLLLKKKKLPKTLIVIPISQLYSDDKTHPLSDFKGRKLIDWTLITALNFETRTEIVLISADEKLNEYIAQEWPSVKVFFRRDKISYIARTYVEEILYFINESRFSYDFICVIEIEYPLRNSRIIENSIFTADLFDYDSVIGVEESRENIFRKVGNGLVDISDGGDLKIDRESFYIKAGGFSVVRKEFAENFKILLGGNLGFILLSPFETFSIANE
jgi:glycosyltransferase involved in cell wall biosynthesis